MPGKPGSLGSTPIVADFAVKSSAIFRQIAADFPASIEPQKPQCAGSPADRMSRRVYARGSFGEHRGRFLVAKTRSAGARPPGATRLPIRRPYGCAINQQRFRRSRKMRIIVILLSLMTLALGGCQGNRLNGSTAAPVAVGGDLGGLGVGGEHRAQAGRDVVDLGAG